MPKLKFKTIVIFVISAFVAVFLLFGYYAQKQLVSVYNEQDSVKIEDRYRKEICAKPNPKGYYARYNDYIPPRFKELLIKKEDKYFYEHFGFNPVSIWQVFLEHLELGTRKASSTISQQLVKILLGKEQERSLKNKITESLYALALEIYQSKEEILKMYANSVYFGNKAQGVYEASCLYFGVDPDLLTDGQILELLATISSPNENNPAEDKNKEIALWFAPRLGLNENDLVFSDTKIIQENMKKYSPVDASCFEFSWFPSAFSFSSGLTIDSALSEKIRKIVQDNIANLWSKNARNAAVVVIKLPENEILAVIGSPDPQSSLGGYKIDMTRQPRAIGSTIKPFIYLKAFEKNLRPYTLVDDREYKYITALGFPLYPKNFDWKYRGEVSLHYALSNSLNVPAVKVLEYVELENFYKFLEEDLKFKPIQSLDNYQLGIALGSLEMSLMDLTKYFTIFPNYGMLKELKIYSSNNSLTETKIADEKYIQLINKILSDRRTGIEQFGLKSDLNLFQDNYALKTGTSRDFKDSWVIGYTPDFLVGVWVGNADASAMDKVSGQAGAGRIWSETMELLLNSPYDKKTPFRFDLIKEFGDGDNIEYGLFGDHYEKYKNILKEKDASIILTPYDGDMFLLEENTKIILKAKENVKWFSNDQFLGESEKIIFTPKETGQYQIKAESSDGKEDIVTIFVN